MCQSPFNYSTGSTRKKEKREERTKGGAAVFGCAEITPGRVSSSARVTKVEAADGDPGLQPAGPR